MPLTVRDSFTWEIFLAAAERGSITQAALALDLDIAKVSRTIAMLESVSGKPLFDRTTRPFTLTAFGAATVSRVAPLMTGWQSFAEEFEAARLLSAEAPVRIATPVGIGRCYLARALRRYRNTVRDFAVETLIEQGIDELLERKIDLAVLPYRPDDARVRVFPCMDSFTVPLASTAYLKQNSAPRTIGDLTEHVGLLKIGPNYPATVRLFYSGKPSEMLDWKKTESFIDMMAVRDALLAGDGIAVDLPVGMVLDEIECGQVVAVLPGWRRDFWHYSIVLRAEDCPDTELSRLAAWLAEHMTARILKERDLAFSALGLDPEVLSAL